MVNNIISKAKKKKTVWSSNDVEQLFNSSYDGVIGKLKKEKDYKEIADWLNKGYFQIEQYPYPDDNFPYISNKKALNEALAPLTSTEEMITQIQNTNKYSDVVAMKYHAWKWLKEQGADDIEYKTRNYSFVSKEKKCVIQVFNRNPQHFINSFLKGVSRYAVAPLKFKENGNNIMFIFTKTQKFEEFLNRQKKEGIELKKFFIRTKSKGELKHEHEIESYNYGNLISFNNGNEKVRGIMLDELASGREGLIKAVSAFRGELKYYSIDNRDIMDPERMLGLKQKRPKLKWDVDKAHLSDNSVLVKCIKKNPKNEVFSYITVDKRDIIESYSCIPDGNEMRKSIQSLIFRSNVRGISLDISDEEGETHADYDPQDHKITLYYKSIIHWCIYRFIHEGLRPIDTIELLIAHELGHASPESRHLFTSEYFSVINEANRLNKEIQPIYEGMIKNSIEKEVIEGALDKFKRAVLLLEIYNELNLKGERDAFEFGRVLVKKELRPFFEKESFKSYQGYVNEGNERIYQAKRRLEIVQNSLATYEKVDWDFPFDF